MATVPVGGASVGLLNSTTLYVAGSPVPPGTKSTYDAVNVSNMTRITANSVRYWRRLPHHDGTGAQQQALYRRHHVQQHHDRLPLRGECRQQHRRSSPLPPRGAITSLLAITNRNVVYAIEGGYLVIYDTNTDTPQSTQIIFTGALTALCRWINRR